MTTLEFRTIPEAHLDRALDLTYLVFLLSPDEERRKLHRDMLLGAERIGAYDGDDLVGMLAARPLLLSVPGGELPCAGVTFVSVAPTHRRRGVLRGMMDELGNRCRDNGQPLAALWAAEAVIYGRFGFGAATHCHGVEIDSLRPLNLRIEPADLPVRLVDPADAPGLLGPLHAANRARRAGRVARDDDWWRTRTLPATEEDAPELSAPRVVTLGAPGTPPAGYAVYRTGDGSNVPGAPDGIVAVSELEADTPGAAAALWRYLASIDLTARVRAWGRPLDDPLLHFAADRDQVLVSREFPALWLRVLDVTAALEARAWAAPCDLVLEITDPRAPGGTGRHRLAAGPDGATVTRTDDTPDLTFDVRELSACYLGGTELRHLARAGLVTEHTPGAVARLDAALRTEFLPHTTDEF
ncbi:GNAT family N-acetyltransferase [Streptomyces sp. AV19]|uniref:GNAT family N-acetyltransferase n=1 Tax=Streptomyces sp. AV19 TaxID=2793068 RepID=UPI0018FEBD9F|nr:GNAT family N-acetyltransferase [Streptomyces sp. AV19]MBH1933295.1 GNAT family N-acetyltransferase [Streptomyces sp. AV19]MDG4536186.1 GNAT family N-acetyltransferase [Streptomyces sp. AV19]